MKLTIPLENRRYAKKDSTWNAKWFSLNTPLHWAKKAQIKRDWQFAVVGACTHYKVKKGMVNPVIQITIYFPTNHPKDPDNFEPIKKPIMDGLVQYGLIADDTTAHYQHRRIELGHDKDAPRVEIEITEV